ncbi:MAG: NosD domain-containing protein [Candidatus Hodarchaeales archaeon]
MSVMYAASAIVDSQSVFDTNILIDSNTFSYPLDSTQEIINLRRVKEVTISNNDFYGASYGIEVEDYDPKIITIESNSFSQHSLAAIRFSRVNSASITNNVIEDMETDGIVYSGSVDIEVHGNTIKNVTRYGINASSSNDTVIKGNILSRISGDVIHIQGNYNENISITQNQISYSKLDGIDITNVTSCTIQGNFLNSIYQTGLKVVKGRNLDIEQNSVSECFADGIFISSCNNSNVNQNEISNVESQSIYFYKSNNFTAESNVLSSGYDGIYCYNSLLGIIKNNIVKSCSHFGLYLSSGSANVDITKNVVIESSFGLYISGDNNTVMNNSLILNKMGAVLTASSEGNLVVYNDFIENLDQAQDDGTGNLFSLNVLSVYFGNYWSDYSGTDVLDPIGFGDTPYDAILGGSGNSDEYPLMTPWNTEAIVPPTISHPADLVYTVGTSGHVVAWSGSSLIPNSYTVSINGSVIKTGIWDGQVIIASVDGLPVGVYSVKCTFIDKLGQSTSDIVQVTVAQVGGSTGTTTTTQPETSTGTGPAGNFDPIPSFMFGMLSSLGLVVVAVVLLRIMKRKKS